MKCRIIMKCPATLDDAIEQMVSNNIKPKSEEETLEDSVSKYKNIARKWFRWGELVTLEIDFEENTCTVVEA